MHTIAVLSSIVLTILDRVAQANVLGTPRLPVLPSRPHADETGVLKHPAVYSNAACHEIYMKICNDTSSDQPSFFSFSDFRLDLIDYEKLGPSPVPFEDYAIEIKAPHKSDVPSENKTIVLIIGTIRGGERAQWSMYRHFMDINNLDCALIVSKDVGKRTNSLYSRCKYVFESKHDFDHPREALNQVIAGRTNAMNMTAVESLEAEQWGPMSRLLSLQFGSAIFTLFQRWVVKQVVFRYNLQNLYDRFVLTRSDHFYACDTDLSYLNNKSKIYIVEQEDYGGINDRHWIIPRNDIFQALSIVDSLLMNITYYNTVKDPYFHGNIEGLMKLRLNELGLMRRVDRFARTMFVAKNIDDDNHLSPVGYFESWEKLDDAFGVYPKYYYYEYSWMQYYCEPYFPVRHGSRLVLIISPDPRKGNEATWESLHDTFLTSSGTAEQDKDNRILDCAIVSFSGTHSFPRSSKLTSLCKYLWEFEPHENDWGEAIDRIVGEDLLRISPWRRPWPHIYGGILYSDLNENVKPYIVGEGIERYNAANLYLRWATSQKLHELGLVDIYEEFFITRPHYKYKVHNFNFTNVNPRNIWIASASTTQKHNIETHRSEIEPEYVRKLLHSDFNFMRCTFMHIERCLCILNDAFLRPKVNDKRLHKFYYGETVNEANSSIIHEINPPPSLVIMLEAKNKAFENFTSIITENNITLIEHY